jgi:hypothetical protein
MTSALLVKEDFVFMTASSKGAFSTMIDWAARQRLQA